MSVEAINRALAGDRMVLLLLQRTEADDPSPDDLHPVGTVAIVRQMAMAQNGMRVLVEGIARVQRRAAEDRRRPDAGAHHADARIGRALDRNRCARPPAAGTGRPRAVAGHRPLSRHQGARVEPRRSAPARLPAGQPARHEGRGQAEAARGEQRPRQADGGLDGAVARDRGPRAEGQDRVARREGDDRRAAAVPAAPADEGDPDRARRGRRQREPGAARARRRRASARADRSGGDCAKSIGSSG